MFGAEKYRLFLKHPGYNGGGKGGGGSTTTVQKADPWSGVQPYLTEGYGRAEQLYAPGKAPEYYPGETYAPNDPLTTASRDMMLGYAQNTMPQDINAIRQAYGSLMGAMDVDNNPYLAKAVQGAINPMIDMFNEEIMPNIRNGEILAGQFGGSEGEEAAGLAAGKLTRNIGDVSSQMYSDAYQKGMDTTMKSMLFGPQIMQLGMMPAQTIGQVGAMNEGDVQKQINDSVARWNYEQQVPYTMLSDYMQLLQGAAPYGTQTMSSPMQTNPLMGALGGVGMAGSLIDGGLAYGLTNPFSWPLLLGGGLLGGLLG